MWRLEWPRIKEDGNQTWLAKSEPVYGLALEMEWDNSKISNRFTCYYMDAVNSQSNVGRQDSFKEDPEIPEAYRSKLRDYSGSGYARGHLCPSADRRASYDQQALTYYLSNMQPQWQNHNGGQWMYLEDDVRKWADRCDTLYVVKAATIDDVTLSGSTESGVYSTTYNGQTYSDLKCNGRLLVSKYYYMALLAYNKSTKTYQAMGIWTKHYNGTTKGASGSGSYDWPIINKENAQYITIDELEQRTGIDFFCNLPDDIEDDVEATLNTTYWSSGAALNR
jgi:endonuclease G